MKKQAGFSALEGLLILVIVGIVGFTGWYVLQSRNKASSNYSAANTAASSPLTYTKKNAKSNQPAQAQKFLTIKEWGVKMPYSSTDSDTYTYVLSNGNQTASLISANLSSKYGCTTFGAGLIQKYAASDNIGPNPTGQELTAEQDAAKYPDSIKKVGNYYYIWRHDNAACSDNVQSLGDSQNNANDATSKMYQNITSS